MPTIIPAVLEQTIEKIIATIQSVPEAHHWHIDIMDSQFVPTSVNFFPEELAKLPSNISWDLHLMVNEPAPWVSAGVILKNSRTFYLHVESGERVIELMHRVRNIGRTPAVVINPTTDINRLNHFFPWVDEILVMGVIPGSQGRSMEPGIPDRIQELKKRHPSAVIGIDGGVRCNMVCDLIKLGAEEIVVGSAIVKEPDPQHAYQEFLKAITCNDKRNLK